MSGTTPRRGRTGAPPPDPAALVPEQAERRARIVRAALHLLEDGEYDAIQMRDVAAGADVALGTMYRYFVSKEHLFAAVLVEWSDSLEHRVEGAPLRGDDVAAQLADLMDRVVTAFERRPQFYRLMVAIESTPDPYARDLLHTFVARSQATFALPLAPLAPRDAQAVLYVTAAVLDGNLRAWALGHISASEVHRRVRSAITLVFSPPPVPMVPAVSEA